MVHLKNFDDDAISVKDFIEGTPHGIALINGVGKIALINQRLATTMGSSVEDLLGRKMQDLVKSPVLFSRLM